MTDLTFYFDPACPWAWRTYRWIRNLQEVRPLAVEWRLFSLREVNRNEETPAGADPVLRVLAAARRESDTEGLRRLYQALATARHVRHEVLSDAAVVEAALHEAGFAATLRQQALDDSSTEATVLEEHRHAIARHGAFGVPWLVPGGQDVGFYGPVVTDPPSGAAAVELWDHAVWLMRQPYVFELKRERA